jgi:hypothetical protein
MYLKAAVSLLFSLDALQASDLLVSCSFCFSAVSSILAVLLIGIAMRCVCAWFQCLSKSKLFKAVAFQVLSSCFVGVTNQILVCHCVPVVVILWVLLQVETDIVLKSSDQKTRGFIV